MLILQPAAWSAPAAAMYHAVSRSRSSKLTFSMSNWIPQRPLSRHSATRAPTARARAARAAAAPALPVPGRVGMGGRPAGTTAARGDGCSSSEPPRLVWSHFAGAAAGRILPERMLPPSEQQRQVAPDAAERTAVVAGSRDRERIRTVVVGEHDDLARLLADRIVTVVARANAERDRCVLGLATGSTPLGIYRELIRRHQAGD